MRTAGSAWRAALRCVAALALAAGVAGTAAAACEASGPEAPVESRRDWQDAQRSAWTGEGPRPLRAYIWHPRGPHAQRLPLVLLSHGSGGAATDMAWLGCALAAGGYAAVAVDHNGTAEEEIHDALTATDYHAWERPRDLSAVLDRLLRDPEWSARIDPDRIGAAGFSLGGTSALWLAGARLDLALLRRQAPDPPAFLADTIGDLERRRETDAVFRESWARAESSYRDPRVRSVFALAPAIGFGFADAGLRRIDIPVRIVVGRDDRINPPAANAYRFAGAIPTAEYVELPGERGHFTVRTPDDARAAELAQVATFAVRFFEATLAPKRDDVRARTRSRTRP